MEATRVRVPSRKRSPSLQPAPRLQLEKARRHARPKGARQKTGVMLNPRRRGALGARNHARCRACSRVPVLVGCGGRMISFVLARGGVYYFVPSCFLKKCLGHTAVCGGGGASPGNWRYFFGFESVPGESRGEGKGEAPGARPRSLRASAGPSGAEVGARPRVPPEPKGVGRGERRRGRGGGAVRKRPAGRNKHDFIFLYMNKPGKTGVMKKTVVLQFKIRIAKHPSFI